MNFLRKPAVSPQSILKPISSVRTRTGSPKVSFGTVECDSCSSYGERIERVGRRVQSESAERERSDVWQSVLTILREPSETLKTREIREREREILTVGETWPRYADQPAGPGRFGVPPAGAPGRIPLAESDPYGEAFEI